MINKRILFYLLLFSSISILAEEPSTKVKFYGMVRTDFFYNSRKNQEALDGLYYVFPKPVDLNAENSDINSGPQAEFISIATRIGMDITGNEIFGAKSFAKVETDFGGAGTNFYLLRLRQAYFDLNWERSELLIGQAWHPMFNNVSPVMISFNSGSPFQPLNWSPQILYKQKISQSWSASAACIYQMFYASDGPLGFSSSYNKKSMIPDIYLGVENNSSHWISGIGFDIKTIKPDKNQITSVGGMIYAQYQNPLFQFKTKAVLGQNMSEHVMIGGYGISQFENNLTTAASYTNLNTLTYWVNAVYGKKVQYGFFAGFSQNLGTNRHLAIGQNGNLTAYGYGFYKDSQQLIDRLYRISPHVSYNIQNLKLGLEYNFDAAVYGKIKNDGRVYNPYTVNNHRIVALMNYSF
jgi:hypothetical protein